MNILFTICGRAGSKGFKDKNLKEMNGIPLVYYTLATIKGYIDKHVNDFVITAVNTDSRPLIELVNKQRSVSVVDVRRKDVLTGDLVPKVDVIKDTYLECIKYSPDVVIDLDITSPLRRIEDIENVLDEYNKGSYDLVFSVVNSRRSPYFNMVERKTDDFYHVICASNYTTRQQTPDSYEMNASIYAYKPSFLDGTINKTILEYKCGIARMPDYLVLDIDSEEDFEMMEHLHLFFCEKDVELMNVYSIARSFLL